MDIPNLNEIKQKHCELVQESETWTSPQKKNVAAFITAELERVYALKHTAEVRDIILNLVFDVQARGGNSDLGGRINQLEVIWSLYDDLQRS